VRSSLSFPGEPAGPQMRGEKHLPVSDGEKESTKSGNGWRRRPWRCSSAFAIQETRQEARRERNWDPRSRRKKSRRYRIKGRETQHNKEGETSLLSIPREDRTQALKLGFSSRLGSERGNLCEGKAGRRHRRETSVDYAVEGRGRGYGRKRGCVPWRAKEEGTKART